MIVDRSVLNGFQVVAEGYKIFNYDWTANYGDNYCYADKDGNVEGVVHRQEGFPDKCHNGLHFCENPLDCFNYYPFVQWNKFAKVRGYGAVSKDDKDSKVAVEILEIVKILSINEFIDTGCISRNWTRREDHGIYWLELHLAVRSVGNPREGCHWLSLASCTHDQDFIGCIVFDLIWLDNGSSRDLDVAKLDSIDDGFFHRASKDDDLTTGLNSGLSSLLETEDIRSKGGKNDAPMDAFDDLHDGLANHFFRVSKGWDFRVG